MNRRDLLKRATTLALGLPAMNASGLINPLRPKPPTGTKDLVVSFDGPFCYWLEDTSMKVMAPPVGVDYHCAAHQAWIGTSANEMMLSSKVVEQPPDYSLTGITPSAPRSLLNATTGTSIYTYEQGTPLGSDPLFNVHLPVPDQIIGVRPTFARIIYKPGSNSSKERLLAAGITFLYKNVELNNVNLTESGQTKFTPCFTNDQTLPCATLSFHLTPIDQRQDADHQHAKFVWSQMLTMYPWMLGEIKGIDFPGYDTSACPNEEPSTTAANKPFRAEPGRANYGPGNDCEVPIMMLKQGSAPGRQKK